jgi:hypothetical protein
MRSGARGDFGIVILEASLVQWLKEQGVELD